MKILLFTTLFLISTTVKCDEKIDSKETNKNEKRGAVGGIIYATKQPQYSDDGQADISPNKIYAKPSPNVAFSTNTVYTQPQQTVAYTKLSSQPTAPVYAAQSSPQASQHVYAPQPQLQYAPQQHAQFVQVAPPYAFAPQHAQPQVYKIGYAQPVQHEQPIQYVQQQLPQQLLYQAPVPVAVAAGPAPVAVKIGYAQPVYQRQVQPAYSTYTSVPTNQHSEYATAPATLTKVGYATPSAIAYSAPQQTLNHRPVQLHYSPASSVSQFSYVSPHVSYGSNGILTQTSYNTKTSLPQQINYSASQPIYTAIPAPSAQYLAHTTAPVGLTKIGYASPAFNYATHH